MMATMRLSDIQRGGDGKGLECRQCGCRDFRVIKTREYWDAAIRRIRECRHCGSRMRTVERAQ